MTSPSLDLRSLREMSAVGGGDLQPQLLAALRAALGEVGSSLPVIEAAHPDHLFDDLEAAVQRARFFAVTGAFRSGPTAAALAFFQHKHRFNLAQVLSWPEADLCLMESRIDGAESARDYRTLQTTYDERYFLADCGGYDAFLRSRGRRLTEVRHHALVALAQAKKGQRILDLGCGRGELSYALSQTGASVTGLDYAAAAIAIAQETYTDITGERLRFICADALTWNPGEKFDTIVLADVVEHIEPPMLDALLARCAVWLAEDGRLLVHTAPNLLSYRFVHRAARAQALAAGAWLPKNPRSFHEDRMHINEQTPKRLQRVLRNHFPYASVWAADEIDPALTLRVPEGSGWTHAPFLYALAAPRAIDRATVLGALSQATLALPPSLAVLQIAAAPKTVRAGAHFTLEARLRNDGTESLSSFAPTPLHLGVHWFHENGGVAVWDGDRTRLPGRVPPAARFEISIGFTAPSRPGRYRARLAMVQEHVAWHEDALTQAVEFIVEVN